MAEFRKIIGREEGRDAEALTLANERTVDLVLKRANMQSKKLVEVTIPPRNNTEDDENVGHGLLAREG